MNRSSTSSCPPTRDLTLYHYRELNTIENRQMEEHLQRCDICRRELERLEATLALLPKEEASFSEAELRSFRQRLNRRLRARQRRPLRPAVGWSLAAATAILLLVTLRYPSPAPHSPTPGVARLSSAPQQLPDTELLLNMDMLEKLDLLQQLADSETNG